MIKLSKSQTNPVTSVPSWFLLTSLLASTITVSSVDAFSSPLLFAHHRPGFVVGLDNNASPVSSTKTEPTSSSRITTSQLYAFPGSEMGIVDIALAGGVFVGSLGLTIWKGMGEVDAPVEAAVSEQDTMTVKEALAKVAAMEAEEESFDVTTSLAVTTDTPTKPPPVAVVEEEKPITQKPVAKTPVAVVPPPAPVPVPAPPVVVAATPTKKPARTQQLKLLIPNPVTQMPSTTKDSTKNVEENIAAARREVASTLAQVREAQSRMPQSSGLLTTNNGKRKKIDATPASATIDENAKENSLPIATPENSVAETPLFTSSTAKAKTTNPFLAMLKYIFRSLFKILTFWRRGGNKSTTA